MDINTEAVLHGMYNCRVPYSVKEHGSIETNVAIETVDGKYGLVWSDFLSPDFCSRLLDYRYDNIDFINEDNSMLIVCLNGKVGLYSLEVRNDDSETVVIKELLPCRYNRIERSRLNYSVLMVYSTLGVMWFNSETQVLSKEYDNIEELTHRYLLLERKGRNIILDLQRSKIIRSVP